MSILKKVFSVWIAIVCATGLLNAEVNKEELLTRIAQKYAGMQEFSGKYEINMQMMGSIMKMPASFWKKGDKMLMEMKMSQPGMPKPMEMVMLMDGEKIIQYHKMLNTVMTIDLSKLPEEMRNQVKQQQSGMLSENTLKNLQSVLDSVEVVEKVRDGKNFYLITMDDIEKIGNMISMPGGQQQNTQQMFKKALIWVGKDSLYMERMELFGEADTPGMWIDFLEFKTDSIPDSVFKLDIPVDAKTMDMTDMIKNMAESMR
jgi:outer membrane lipoprotein-sorting protein